MPVPRVDGSALIRTLLLTLAITLAMSLIAGSLYQWLTQRSEDETYPPPGELFEVAGSSVHLDCRGAGSPTIVIESGLMSGSASWVLVHDQLAKVTRVCAYDRPGMSWSEPSDEPLRAPAVAARLHQLLDTAAIDDPKILLGMSAGGLFVREYYRHYGDDVVGMVLIDSSHEQQGHRLPEIDAILDMSSLLSACSWLQPVGIVRAFDLLDESIVPSHLDSRSTSVLRSHAYQSHTCAAMLNESEGFETEVRDPEPPASLGDLPLLVVSQGKAPADHELQGYTREQADELMRRWDELQRELAGLSTISRRVIASNSGHMVHLEQPELIVSEVTALVDQVQNSSY
jgi:pimeloyl-ACP methyl ester carboxylesterase